MPLTSVDDSVWALTDNTHRQCCKNNLLPNNFTTMTRKITSVSTVLQQVNNIDGFDVHNIQIG